MTRNRLLALLIMANLLLGTVVVMFSAQPPTANAQPVLQTGEYILVSAEAQRDYDVIYLMDLARRQLHAFRAIKPDTAGQPVIVRWLHMRDMIRDFRR